VGARGFEPLTSAASSRVRISCVGLLPVVVEIMDCLDWYEMHMGVSHIQATDKQTNLLGLKSRLKDATEELCDGHQVLARDGPRSIQ
jgi:hypothetical protein